MDKKGSMIYEPAEDSFLLQKHIKTYIKPGMSVLDMGTGSGILAQEAKKYTKNVIAVDINPEAVEHVKKQLSAIVSDLFQNVKGKFDLIIFNPPYLPEDPEEPQDSKQITSGGKQGYELLEKFFQEAKSHLNKDGKILFLYSSLTGDVETIPQKQGFIFSILERQKIFFEELVVALAEVQH